MNCFRRSIILILFLGCFFSISSFNDLKAKTTIRFATVAPDGSAWMDVMRAIGDEVKEKSGGEVVFKYYPNMSMGDEKDIVRKMRLGQIQSAGFTGFGLGEVLSEFRILELPHLFNNDAEVDFVNKELFEYFNSNLLEKGFVLLGWVDVGWVYFFSDKPITTPTDLADTKVWTWQGDPLAHAFFEALGKSPVPLSVTDVLLSLQTGLINAAYSSPLAALALQWFTHVDFISDVPFTHSNGAVLITKKSFDKLSIENKSLVKDVASKHLKTLVERSRRENIEAYDVMLKRGVTQVPSNEEQRAEMMKISLQVHEKLSGDLFPPELLANLQNLLFRYRSQPDSSTSNP
ncbi:MAG: TRAP transporter substrate-binding protein DctP [Calditrichaeota bacterium]|nr:TRAP transporter substrate-binding protein DctP [Calditrichota bacterium]MBT7788000.1 TRAP transporter substrate-binding protein DctP [Calditrichota bacterium]